MKKLLSSDLSFQACEKVRTMIINKELKPGQKIIQDKLAEDLGISRTPLRSALQILEGEGLVESIPRKGMIVKIFTKLEIIEVFDCRIALESLAVKLFIENATKEDFQTLKSFFQPFEDNFNDFEGYRKADSDFHQFLVEKSGNSYLLRLYSQSNLLSIIDAIGLIRPATETMSEHRNIIQAIEKKDIEKAQWYVEDHLIKSKVLLKQNIATELQAS